jgi:hypothetical protein
MKIINIMDLVNEEDIPALLINVDFEKAFDLLEINYVDECLKKKRILDIISGHG